MTTIRMRQKMEAEELEELGFEHINEKHFDYYIKNAGLGYIVYKADNDGRYSLHLTGGWREGEWE